MKSMLKKIVGNFVSDYRINWIVASPESPPESDIIESIYSTADYVEQLEASQTPKMRNAASFARAGYIGYALVEAGCPICATHFADKTKYGHTSTWPLLSGEIALLDIATEEAWRGQGAAGRLIRATTNLFKSAGCNRLIAFIWWSNGPSLRAFRKANWRIIGFSLEFKFDGRWRKIRIPLGKL